MLINRQIHPPRLSILNEISYVTNNLILVYIFLVKFDKKNTSTDMEHIKWTQYWNKQTDGVITIYPLNFICDWYKNEQGLAYKLLLWNKIIILGQ